MNGVSVIVCSYNDAAVLGDALASLYRQTLPLQRYEVVLIDDGSTDATNDVIGPFRQQENFRYVRHPRNLGLVRACNRGVQEARGDYFVRLDADDAFLPEALEAMCEPLDRGAADLVYSDRYERVAGQSELRQVTVGAENLFNLIAIGTMMRRRIVEAVGGYRELFWEEHDLHLRYVLKSGKPPCYLPRPLVIYARGRDRMTSDPAKLQAGWDELARLWPADVLRRFGRVPALEAIRQGHGTE